MARTKKENIFVLELYSNQKKKKEEIAKKDKAVNERMKERTDKQLKWIQK